MQIITKVSKKNCYIRAYKHSLCPKNDLTRFGSF